jgi:hypothetical protein
MPHTTMIRKAKAKAGGRPAHPATLCANRSKIRPKPMLPIRVGIAMRVRRALANRGYTAV